MTCHLTIADFTVNRNVEEFVILFEGKKVQHACHHISNQSVAGVHNRSLMFETPTEGYALQQHILKQASWKIPVCP